MDSDTKRLRRVAAELDEPVAANGLLHRRAFLRGGIAFTGFAAAAVTAHDAAAQAAAATGEKLSARTLMTQAVMGGPFTAYGQPARYERDAVREFTVNQLTPGTGSSRTPHHVLEGMITPSGLHFQRNHNGVPDIEPNQHQLLIHGLVKRPLTFTLDSLSRYPMESHIRFVECAGNNGGFNAAEPRQADVQAMHGLLSSSEWTGVRLAVLLDEAGVDPKGKWILAEGGDGASMSRSVPIEKCMDDAVIALYQNGERIRPEQGYPMRLLLPGFEGNMNVKWLHRIQVTPTPTFTKDETSKYTELMPNGKARQFMFQQPVNSFITKPSYQINLQGPGYYEISGLAWSGAGKIAKVEISADEGKSWAQAALVDPVLPMAVTRFRLPWKWSGQPLTLVSRATDEKKNVQPTRSQWLKLYAPNQGYKFNGITAWAADGTGQIRHVYI